MATQKDYVTVGQALRAALLHADADGKGWGSELQSGVRLATQRIADAFSADDSRFDRERFVYFVETGVNTRNWQGHANRVRTRRDRENGMVYLVGEGR